MRQEVGGGAGPAAPEARGPGVGRASLFPLPHVPRGLAEELGLGGRALRRAVRDANTCLDSLNWLYGGRGCCWENRSGGKPVAEVFMQQKRLEAVGRVLRLCGERPRPPDLPSPQESLSALLRGRGVYDTQAAYSTLAAFKHGAVSLPDSVQRAPMLSEILPDSALQYLEGFEELMLRDD